MSIWKDIVVISITGRFSSLLLSWLKAPRTYLSGNDAKASGNIYPAERHPALKVTLLWRHHSRKRKHLFFAVCWPLWTENLKTLRETQEVCFTPRRKKNNKMSSSLTAFGSRVTQTRSTYMPGPRDNKRCLTSRTLSHNSDGLEHNRSWQGHESRGGRLVCRPPGRRQLLSASVSPNLQSLHGNTHLFSKQSLFDFTLGCAGRTSGWLTRRRVRSDTEDHRIQDTVEDGLFIRMCG